MKSVTILFPLLAIALSSVTLAGSPFDGTWTPDAVKSQLAGDTFSVEDAGGGRLKFSDSTGSYIARLDGSPVTTPLGDEQTYKQIGDGTYTATTKRNGVLLTTENWRLSSDGSSLFIEGRGTRPNGQAFENHSTYIRTSAGSGLVGSWKSVKVKTSGGETLMIQSTEQDDVTLTLSATKATVHAKWDGRDYPYRGPTIPAGITLALSKTGTDGFRLVQKIHGKVVSILRFRLARDGTSMVDEATDAKGRKLSRVVWDKGS